MSNPNRRGRSATYLLLGTAAVVGGLAAAVAHGFALEYGDTSRSNVGLALGALRGWAPVLGVVMLLAGLAVWRSRRGLLAVLAATVVAGSVTAVPAGTVLGVRAKFDRYPATPRCDTEITSGPAAAVTRAAERAFAELDHPGPFSGGGSSGVDGCESQVMLRDDSNPVPAYLTALAAADWTVRQRGAGLVRAEKGEQAFELREQDGMWLVWIGPVDVRHADDRRGLGEGEVGG